MTEFQDTLTEKYQELENRMTDRPLEFSVNEAMKEFDVIVSKFLNRYQIQKESPTAAQFWEAAREKKLELKRAFNVESKKTAEALTQMYQSNFHDLEIASFLPSALQEQKRLQAYNQVKEKDFIKELNLNPNEDHLEYFGEIGGSQEDAFQDAQVNLPENWFKKNNEKTVVPKAINGVFRGYSVCNGEPEAKTLLQKTFQQYQEIDTDWLGTANLYYDDIGKIGLEQEWISLHKNMKDPDWYTPELQGYALGYLLAAKHFFKDQASYDGYKTDLFEQIGLFREKLEPELFLQSLITPQEWVEARYSQVAQDVIAKIAPTYDLIKEMFPDFTFEGEKEFLRFQKEPPGRNEILQVKEIQKNLIPAVQERWKKMQEDIAVILTHRAYFSGHGFKVPPMSDSINMLLQPFDFSLLPEAIQEYANLKRHLQENSEIFQKNFKRRMEESREKLRKQFRSNRPEYKQIIGMLEQIERSFPDLKNSIQPDHWEKLIAIPQDISDIRKVIENAKKNNRYDRNFIIKIEKKSIANIKNKLLKELDEYFPDEKILLLEKIEEEFPDDDEELSQAEKRARLLKLFQQLYQISNTKLRFSNQWIVPSEMIFEGYEIKEPEEELTQEKETEEETPQKPASGEPTIEELERQEKERIKKLRPLE